MPRIAKRDINMVKRRYNTRRAQFMNLAALGYSHAEIATTYRVSKRAVWNALNAPGTPRELRKLARYRVPLRRGSP